MGPGAFSSLLLLLLLLVATGDADMKGHFDPGEKNESWVPEGQGLGAGSEELGALTHHMLCSSSQVPLRPGHARPHHSRQ